MAHSQVRFQKIRRPEKMKVIDQSTIVDFVTAVEKKKNFKADPDKVFRHIVSEIGELDGAMHDFDKSRKSNDKLWQEVMQKSIGHELLDVIFLVCYMADIYKLDLNDLVRERIDAIKREYSVEWEKKDKPWLA